MRSWRRQRSSVISEQLEQKNLLNAAPIAGDDVFLITQDQPAVFSSLLLNDEDADGDPLQVLSVSDPEHGTLTDQGNNVFHYVPNPGFAGRDTFEYIVGDGLETATAKVIVAVNQPIDVSAARDQILDGVRSIANPVQPGRMVAFGPQAAALAYYEDGIDEGPLAAVAGWGHGRVIAMPDHQSLNLASQGPKSDTAKFYENSIAWLAGSESKNIKIVVYDDAGDAQYLRDEGFTQVVNAASTNAVTRELRDADVFMAGWLGSNPSNRLLDTTADYVRDGGGLFVADYGVGYSWWWNRELPDAPGNRLLREAGIGFGSGNIWDGDPIDTRDKAVGQINAEVVLQMLDDSRGFSANEIEEGGYNLGQLFNILPENDSLLAELDQRYQARIVGINPTPERPVSDPFEKGLLTREMDLIGDLPPEEVTAHRTAEGVYGDIPDDAVAVNGIFTVDAERSRWQATGYFAAPGELVTIKVPRNAIRRGYEIRINGHRDNISRRSEWDRVPFNVSRSFDIDSETIQVANAFGGSIYIDVGDEPPAASGRADFEVQLENVLEQPYFVLGQSTNEDWEAVRNAPGAYAEFESEHVAISVPSRWIRELEDPAALMKFWDETAKFQDYVGALESFRTGPERFNVDVQISAGLLHAGYPIQGPTSASERIVDLPELRRQGAWGYFHELGHEMQRRPDKEWGYGNFYTFSGDVEVTVNIFSNAALEHSVPNSPTGGWGYSVYPHLVMQRAIETVTDASEPEFDDKDPYPFYFQLADAFGWEMYREVFQTYHDDFANNSNALPDNNQEKKDQFYVRWSEVSGYDMTRYMVDLWGLEVSQLAKRRVSQMDLPDFLPAVANVPGNLTAARDASLRIDLSTNNIISFDGTGSIGSLMPGEHGSVSDNGDGTWTYYPDVGFTGTDKLTFEVVSSTGYVIQQTLDINVVTQGVLLETFTDISGSSVRNLTRSANYPDAPSEVTVLPSFEAPTNRGSNFGARARGWITAPTTGRYRFFIASDDNGELHLSTDASPDNATRVARVPGWSSPRQWNKFPEQTSSVINLEAGERYYIEALMKEGGGGDNLAVAWDGPGFRREVIPLKAVEVYYEGNARPYAMDDAYSVADAVLTFDVLENDTDRDGDSLTLVDVANPANGSAVFEADGRVTYRPNAGFAGVETFTYKIVDENGAEGEALVTIDVGPTNDLDCNADGSVDQGDLDCICDSGAVDELLAKLGLTTGDMDGDGEVAFADFLILSGDFGQTDVGYTQGDLDCDGVVGFNDFLILSGNFGT